MKTILSGSTMFLAILVSATTASAAGAREPGTMIDRRPEMIAFGLMQPQQQNAVIDADKMELSQATSSGQAFVLYNIGQRPPAAGQALKFQERGAAPAPVQAYPAFDIPAWMLAGPIAANRASSCLERPYRPTGFLRFDAERRRLAHYAMMSEVACQYGLPIDLFDALIMQESRYRPDALSAKNAFGLTQLMPGTALELGVDRHSVDGNLQGGARYLRRQLDRFGQYDLALAAYNAGPGRIRNGRMPSILETRVYVGNILSTWSRLSAMTIAPTLGVRDDATSAQRQVKVQLF